MFQKARVCILLEKKASSFFFLSFCFSGAILKITYFLSKCGSVARIDLGFWRRGRIIFIKASFKPLPCSSVGRASFKGPSRRSNSAAVSSIPGSGIRWWEKYCGGKILAAPSVGECGYERTRNVKKKKGFILKMSSRPGLFSFRLKRPFQTFDQHLQEMTRLKKAFDRKSVARIFPRLSKSCIPWSMWWCLRLGRMKKSLYYNRIMPFWSFSTQALSF